jgi:hypothetical protein
MFDHNKIIEAFTPLVGMRQNNNPEFTQIPPSITYNGSNLLIDHPLLNIENIDMTARNYGKYQYPAYNPLTAYTTGVRVTYNDINYEAIDDSTGQQPDSSPDYWQVLDLLSQFLTDIWASAAVDTVNNMFNIKRIAGQSKTLLSSMKAFEGAGTITDRIINEGNLVGISIKLLSKQNLLAVIDQIGIQLSAPVPNLKFYVYHSSQLEPIATITVNHTKQTSFQWHNVNLKLHYLSEEYDTDGLFFIMYDQNELGAAQAIKKQHNFHLPPCAYCNSYNVTAFNSYSKYVKINSVRVKAADRNLDDDLNLWDITKTQTTPDNNNGMNFSITAKCDLTDFIVRQREVFQYAMRDVVTEKILEVMSSTTRQNVAQGKLDVLARNELMSQSAGGMGFRDKVKQQLKAIDFEISALDDLCMPCNKKSGLGYGTSSLSFGR